MHPDELINLSGNDFSAIRFPRGMNFRRVILDHAKFRESYLEVANFEGASVNGTDFSDAQLGGSDFRGSSCCEAILFKTRLKDANANGSVWDNAIFEGADLSGIQLTNAYARRCNFGNACLRKGNLSGSDFTDATFDGAIIDSADLENSVLWGTSLPVWCAGDLQRELQKLKRELLDLNEPPCASRMDWIRARRAAVLNELVRRNQMNWSASGKKAEDFMRWIESGDSPQSFFVLYVHTGPPAPLLKPAEFAVQETAAQSARCSLFAGGAEFVCQHDTSLAALYQDHHDHTDVALHSSISVTDLVRALDVPAYSALSRGNVSICKDPFSGEIEILGDALLEAKELCSVARPGEVLLSLSARRELATDFFTLKEQWRPKNPTSQIKRSEELVKCFQLRPPA